MKAHIEGLKYYAFSVIIRNDLGMILLQKRALTKYHSGGLWSNACCGHPLDISSYQSVNNSAKIRLQEELNINSKLSFLFQFEYSAKCNSLVENELLLILMCLFHEIGHASACKYYKAPIGNVGFGIAGFRPVMFANVSGAWYLNQKQRIIVNIGGVYFQTIFAALLTVLSLQTNSTSLYYVSKTIIISVFLQFYPFYRMDGYWLVSDLMGEPNLYSDAINLLQNKFKTKELKLTKRQKTLLLYFILTEFVVIASLLLFLIDNWGIIICIPEKLWIFFVSLLDGNVNNLKTLNFHFIWVGIILFLLIKSILNIRYK